MTADSFDHLMTQNRHSIRLKGYDYSFPGAYFVTICTYQHRCFFGNIMSGRMQLNEYGEIVQTNLTKIPSLFRNIELGEYIIMPNHIHGVSIIKESSKEEAGFARNKNELPSRIIQHKKVGNIVGAYKSLSANECLKIFSANNEYMGKLWQRNYWEHIIRNDTEYNDIILYIHYYRRFYLYLPKFLYSCLSYYLILMENQKVKIINQ